jgi:adenosylcobyric acid synthase
MNDIPLAPCLCVLGTGSDVGKSIVVTALCRIFRNQGIDVAPFKAQNMSNNSYVTVEGLEMGRAQVVQAQAARVEPLVDMNPVLLKPCTDTGAQVIVHGKAIGVREAGEYFCNTDFMAGKAIESLNRLRQRHELVVMEGAGSCAEVNLRSRDFVNFRMAHASDAPVILVGDINKGGIFAQLVGTLEVLPKEDRDRVKGFIINQFRGDPSLFQDGIEWIEKRTGLPVLGLIPWYYHIDIDSEDGMPLDVAIDPPTGPRGDLVNIAVIRLPHISNFTDFNPLVREKAVNLHYLAKPRSLEGYDLLILPGSKNVRSDLEWLRRVGWEKEINAFHQSQGCIGGVCGGYQMLGEVVRDPDGVEGQLGESPGLGLLPLESTLEKEKNLSRSAGTWRSNGCRVDGYEIHMGVSVATDDSVKPLADLEIRNQHPINEPEGAISPDGRVWGTYLHGLFDEGPFRRQFLRDLAREETLESFGESSETIEEFRDRQYNLLAEHFATNLQLDKIQSFIKK